jgi:hypothetical protein
LRYPEQGTRAEDRGEVTEPLADPGRIGVGAQPHDDAAEPTHDLSTDSFRHYFHRRPHRDSPAAGTDFSREAEPAALTVEDMAPPAAHEPRRPGRRPPRPRLKVHHVRGTRTPDNRTRVVELTMPAKGVLALARAERVSLTIYLIAMFFEAIRSSSGGLGTRRTLTSSVPVNLRQFFPSTSARNFFATVRVAHTYDRGADDVGSVSRQLEGQFRPKATPEALERKLRRFIRFERMPLLRILPRPLKDLILKLVNWGSNRGLSVAVSNLGRVSLPEPASSHVGRMLFHVSAVRPQFCAMSHAGLLTISFTSPYTETAHVREFARLLTARGIDVKVAAARVTEKELTEEQS